MESNFADVLEDGETVDKFVQVAGKGRGMAARSRNYVSPIAVRYVQKHQQHLFLIQKMRRETDADVVDEGATCPIANVTMVDTPSPTPLTNKTFDDGDWSKELEDIEVEEIDGTWRNVTVFRSRTNQDHVCLWFGGDEYEGIDPDHPYSYCPRTESLEDDEGYDINWRTVGVDNDSSDDDDE